jgi:hypothetical protein
MKRIDIVHIEDPADVITSVSDMRPTLTEFTVYFDGEPQEWMGRISIYESTFGDSATSDGIAEVQISGDFGELRLDTRYVAVHMRAEVKAP